LSATAADTSSSVAGRFFGFAAIHCETFAADTDEPRESLRV